MKKLLVVLLAASVGGSVLAGETFRIAVMEAKKGQALKFAPLIAYMKGKGVAVELVGTKSYPDAARKFSTGGADAMFAGSGVAGCMLIKGLAAPVVRPVKKSGTSTYWAVVVARKGAPEFSGDTGYFAGKKILACSLASSGEFFYRSVHKGGELQGKLLKAGSHGAALEALAKGVADCAIVKNRVWDSEKERFAGLVVVGADKGENPDGSLIVSKNAPAALKAKVRAALLAVGADESAAAAKLKESLGVREYIVTTEQDFTHTLALLKDAGVDETFDFKFRKR